MLYIFDLFSPTPFACNYESMLNYLHFKTIYSRRQNLDSLFLINVFRNRIYCSIMDTVGLRVPTKQIRDFSTFNVCNVSKDLALQQGASRLQSTSTNLCTFSVNMTSPLRIHFPLPNPTELRHYHVTFITLLPSITFYSSSSSSLSRAFVMYTFSARLL
jgi:hypothetical protein